MSSCLLEHPYATVADLVRRCEERGAGLRILGNGDAARSLADGTDAAAICDLSSFNRLIAHDRDDMTVTVQAGMTVAALQSHLAEHHQSLPIDVTQPERASVGGMIAADVGGSRRCFRGGVRDLLLGVTVIGSGGRLLWFGGRVVKNVAGYDLCKLHTGSHGWLGAIVEATFRAVPFPEAAAGVAVALQTAAEAEAAYAGVQTGTLRPAAVDLLDGRTAEQLDLPPSPWTLLIAFEDLREVVDAQVTECRRLFDAPMAALGAAETRAALQHVADLQREEGLHLRFNVPSSDVADLMGKLAERRAAERRPAPRLWSHLAEGVVHALFGRDDARGAREAIDFVVRGGGSWMAPRRGDAAVIGLPMFGPPRAEWGLMRRVKSALDPAGAFGRGGSFDLALRGVGRSGCTD